MKCFSSSSNSGGFPWIFPWGLFRDPDHGAEQSGHCFCRHRVTVKSEESCQYLI